ncbi:UNVERIFIED_CONTAM: hypothetical protein GTU68_029882 [Idotea baltica]|nr:hypothetical protein [Idotea baltica]
MRIGMHRPALFAKLKGVSEETTTGTARLYAMQKTGVLPFPALTANDARCKHLFDNRYGTGQTTMQAVLRLTNRQIAGANVAIIGYGYVGRGIAEYAKKMGARVIVAEIDPIKAIQAHNSGHVVSSISDAVLEAEVVFTTTSVAATLTGAHIDAMRSGVMVCSAGCGQAELPMQHLEQAIHKESVREHVMEYQLSSGKKVLLIADGHCINQAAGEGNPIEVTDSLMALQLTALDFLSSRRERLTGGLCSLPGSYEHDIATTYLKELGLVSESPN